MVKRTLGVVGHRGGGEDEAGTVVVHAEAEHQRGPLRLVGAGETAYPAAAVLPALTLGVCPPGPVGRLATARAGSRQRARRHPERGGGGW